MHDIALFKISDAKQLNEIKMWTPDLSAEYTKEPEKLVDGLISIRGYPILKHTEEG